MHRDLKVIRLRYLSYYLDGSIYLFGPNEQSKQVIWRKDLHSYVARKNSVAAAREDQMRLKHEGTEFAICAYTKGDGGATTPESFKRRAYWLKDNPKYVFVHYLDEASKYYVQWMSV
jgi:hypothetical protein